MEDSAKKKKQKRLPSILPLCLLRPTNKHKNKNKKNKTNMANAQVDEFGATILDVSLGGGKTSHGQNGNARWSADRRNAPPSVSSTEIITLGGKIFNDSKELWNYTKVRVYLVSSFSFLSFPFLAFVLSLFFSTDPCSSLFSLLSSLLFFSSLLSLLSPPLSSPLLIFSLFYSFLLFQTGERTIKKRACHS